MSNPNMYTNKQKFEVLVRAMNRKPKEEPPAGLIIDHSCMTIFGKGSRLGPVNPSREPANRNALLLPDCIRNRAAEAWSVLG